MRVASVILGGARRPGSVPFDSARSPPQVDTAASWRGGQASAAFMDTEESPDFAAEPLRTAMINVFRENGAHGDVKYVRTDDRSEVLFVLSTSGGAGMHQRNIVERLMALLHRKVFVTTESAATDGRTVSL
jgi:hypothetical protein